MSVYNDAKEEVSIAGTVIRVGLIIIVTMFTLGFAANFLGFWQFSFFAPRVEQVRYNVFKESQTYNDGMLRDLQNLKLEYLNADSAHKDAMRSIVIQRFSVYDLNRLPPDLQQFYYSMQGQGIQQ